MKRALYFLVILATSAAAFLAGSLVHRDPATGNPSRRQQLAANQNSSCQPDADLADLPPGTVAISPERQQAVGIRTGQVEKKPFTHTVRLLGRVAADETRIYFINATIDGWITKTLPNTTGSFVKKDQTLAAFYSSEFLSAGQALLYALGSMDRVRATGAETAAQKDQFTQFKINLQQYKDSLRNLGMGDLQIEEMIRTRKYMENVNITAPADGIILSRNVSPGQRFEKGTEFYRIADISRVWVLADLYQTEDEALRPGVEAQVTLPYQKKIYSAKVSEVPPVFDLTSRTLKVRLEMDNPGFVLRPDMFVDVELPIKSPPSMVIPDDAIMNSGLKKIVFIFREHGIFEPRDVKTGRRLGGQVEIIEGLNEGEKIVISGNFLVDSESKLSLAAWGMQPSLARDTGQSTAKGAMDQPLIVNGKIAYMEKLGGYYIRGEDPPGEMMIVNQDAASLAKLQKADKPVKIQGHFTIGADHFFIEKIDGKPYGGK